MKKLFFIVICLTFLILLSLAINKFLIIKSGVVFVSPITKAIKPSPPVNLPLEFSAWIPWWKENQGIESLEKSSSGLTYLSPSWYKLDETGKIVLSGAKKTNEILKIANSSGTMVIPTVGNDFDYKRVNRLLNNKDLQKKLIKDLLQLAVANKYVGWDLDWEQIDIRDRDSFSSFVLGLHKELANNKLLLFVTIHAQTGEKNDWVGALGQDWDSLGKSADALRIMAYDFHHANSEPGPVTPIVDLEKTLRYALQTIPKEKIVLSLPTYGYDWTEGKGQPLLYVDAVLVIRKNNGSFSRDRESSALFGTYTDSKGSKHEVWFEDSESILQKIMIARSLGIYKFCFWSLGGEDINLWKEIFALKKS